MPGLIKEALGFKSIAERLGVTKTITLPLTRGWSVKFESSQEDENAVWVDFYYNGSMGRDEKYAMSIKCDINTIDSIYEQAQTAASAELSMDRSKYRGCYGLAVYKNLCLLREKENPRK